MSDLKKELSGKIIDGLEYGVDLQGTAVVADLKLDLATVLLVLAAKSSNSWVKAIADKVQAFKNKIDGTAQGAVIAANDLGEQAENTDSKPITEHSAPIA